MNTWFTIQKLQRGFPRLPLLQTSLAFGHWFSWRAGCQCHLEDFEAPGAPGSPSSAASAGYSNSA